MARHRAEHESDEPTTESDVDDTPDTEDEPRVDEPERTAQVAEFWSDLAVDPIEIALPAGVGYTLRAYRSPDDVTAVPGAEPEPTEDESTDTVAEASGTDRGVTATVPDDEDDERAAGRSRKRKRGKGRKAAADEDDTAATDDEPAEHTEDDESAEPTEDDEATGSAEDEDATTDDEDAAADEDESDEDDEEEEEPAGPDEVPVFLSQRGKLLLFHTPEGLVEFVRSDEPHSLRGVEQAESLASRLGSAHIAPDDDDRYELDLLVKNLRGGHDTWDPKLVVSAGELARDLAYALDLQSVQTSLAPGSPLDDLDDAMRGRLNGGIGAFRARRRMRKIGAQQAALAWRTIIGKIGAAVDWRD